MAGLSRGYYADIKVDTALIGSIAKHSKEAANHLRAAAERVNRANKHENWRVSEAERERINTEIRAVKAICDRDAGFLETISGNLEAASAELEALQAEIINTMKSIAYTVD